MPAQRKSASPSHADLLAEAQAAWADLSPTPLLKSLRPGIDYTAKEWAKLHGLTKITAARQLEKLATAKPPRLAQGRYRLPGERQDQWVFWPVGLPAPT